MPDLPDYGLLNAAATVAEVTDLGELAARLGSPVTWDRRGDVLWFDDFEAGLASWVTVTTGTGAAVALATDRARSGRRSVKLTAGSDDTLFAGITHYEPPPVFSRLGLEGWFSLDTQVGKVSIQLFVHDGVSSFRSALRLRCSDGALFYQNAAGGDTQFADGPTPIAFAPSFHALKLVVDADAGKYVRAIIDDTTYDLSGIPAYVSGPALAVAATITALYEGSAGSNPSAWVDNMIFTVNEPELV